MNGALSVLLWLSAPAGAEALSVALPGWGAWRWTTEDGLPINNVSAADVAPDGLLWLSTYDGLARFDGAQFEVFTPGTHPELPTSRFIDVRAGDDGTIWAVSEGGVLVQRRDDRFHTFAEEEHSLGAIVDLVQTSRGLLVLGDAGEARLEGASIVPLEPALELAPGDVSVAMFEQDGRLWVGTARHELWWLDEDARRWTRWPEPAFAFWFARGGHEPTEQRIGFLGDGELIGLAPAEIRSSRRQPVPLPGETGTILPSPDGTPLIGTVEGVFRWEAGALVPAPQRVSATTWWAAGSRLYRGQELLLERESGLDVLAIGDDDDALWLREDGGGLIRVAPAPVQSIQADSIGDIGPTNVVMADRRGGLWMGTVQTPLRRHGEEAQPVLFEGEPVLHTQALLEALDGTIWVFARKQGCVVEDLPARGPIDCVPLTGVDAPDDFISAAQHSDGTMYFGGNDIVTRSPNGSLEPLLSQDTWHPIRDLLVLPDGRAVATALGRGLLLLGQGEPLLREEDSESPIRTVRALWLDAAGDLWLGTEGKGICRLELSAGGFSEAPLVCAGTRQGLAEDFVSSMALDGQGRLWMSSNRGLQSVRFDALVALIEGRREAVSASAIGRPDGMLEPETNGVRKPSVARMPDGRLCYPTMDGVACLEPSKTGYPPPPRVVLQALATPRRGLDLTEPSPIAPDERELTVRWTAAAFRQRQDLRFRYRLAGLDAAWRGPTARGEASWTLLPPGNYTLEIQSGWGEQWGPAQPVASVQVPPVFTETPWFVLLLSLTGGAAVLGLFYARTRQLRQREAVLQHAVEVATAELVERNALIAAQADELVERNARIGAQAERLGKLDVARTRFVANISHELRTPLTLIRGTIEDLPATGLPDAAQRGVAIALRNAERLGDIIDQLIDTARLEAGGVPLRAVQVNLPTYLQRVAERFEGELSRRDITLRRVLPPVLGVWLDPELIDKLMTNLLANAASYTPAGGWIQLAALVIGDDEEGSVEIRVTDTGPGVPEEARAHLFERFYQADSSDRRQRGGAGIGLSLAREIVELHGGSISVANEPGAGACFSVRLPLGTAHLSPDEIALEREADLPALEAVMLPPLPVPPGEDAGTLPLALVVEDNPDMRAYIASHLSAAFTVETAKNGQVALERLQNGLAPVVIVSDIMMPVVDGLTLCRQLRADARWSSVPIMLLSAKSTTQDRVDGLSLADDYLTKPFRAAEMVLRVRKLAASRAAPAPAPAAAAGDAQSPFLRRLQELAHREMSSPAFSARELSRQIALSPRQLLRRVRDETGMTVAAWLRDLRLREAQRLMRSGEVETVGEAAAAVGFSPAYLSRVYRDWAGCPPSDELRR